MKNFLLQNVVPAQILFERGSLRLSERRADGFDKLTTSIFPVVLHLCSTWWSTTSLGTFDSFGGLPRANDEQSEE